MSALPAKGLGLTYEGNKCASWTEGSWAWFWSKPSFPLDQNWEGVIGQERILPMTTTNTFSPEGGEKGRRWNQKRQEAKWWQRQLWTTTYHRLSVPNSNSRGRWQPTSSQQVREYQTGCCKLQLARYQRTFGPENQQPKKCLPAFQFRTECTIHQACNAYLDKNRTYRDVSLWWGTALNEAYSKRPTKKRRA